MNFHQTDKFPVLFKNAPVFLLCCLWLVMVVAVNPVGDFPLNDDWSYGETVRILIEEGRFHLTGWVSMPLIAQVGWGALFCLPTGFSFTSLRLSTLVLGLAGVITVYMLLRECSASRNEALFGAALLAVNPLYLNLSNTFMTDVPFLATAMLALLSLIRGIRSGKTAYLWTGVFFSVLATMIRQLGLVVPLSFAVGYLLRNGVNGRNLLKAFAPLAVTVAALLAYETFIKSTIGLPDLYHLKSGLLVRSLLSFEPALILTTAQYLGELLVYLGLFLLPFTFVSPGRHEMRSPPGEQMIFPVIAISLAGAITALLAGLGILMPLQGNILHRAGLGPVRLYDVATLGLRHPATLPETTWLIITFLGITGIIRFVLFFLLPGKKLTNDIGSGRREKWLIWMLVSACLIYAVPICITGFFDRYILFMVPLVAMLLVLLRRNTGLDRAPVIPVTSILLLFAIGGFSVAGTHDYLAWNRARWLGLAELTEGKGIPAELIDGGFEFNGLYAYDAGFTPVTGPDGHELSWWWVRRADYIISMGPVPGYAEVARYPFPRWLPPGEGTVFVQHRQEKVY
ncbi:MAG: glycosyltransferase family 39 protein [Desulfobacterales bacterium]|nr:glycosyltransferase family 39 protein [Desulfobacterales bacterium]